MDRRAFALPRRRGGGHSLQIKDATLTVNCGSTSAPTSTPAPTPRPTATPTPRPTLTLRPSVATEALSCDSVTVSGTETSAMYWGSYDGLYEKAGECHGQPYYKCTCCTDYDPDVVEMCAADPEGCADENGRAWDQSQCMADIGGGGVHHCVFYSSDDAAWYLKPSLGRRVGHGRRLGRVRDGGGLWPRQRIPPRGRKPREIGRPLGAPNFLLVGDRHVGGAARRVGRTSLARPWMANRRAAAKPGSLRSSTS